MIFQGIAVGIGLFSSLFLYMLRKSLRLNVRSILILVIGALIINFSFSFLYQKVNGTVALLAVILLTFLISLFLNQIERKKVEETEEEFSPEFLALRELAVGQARENSLLESFHNETYSSPLDTQTIATQTIDPEVPIEVYTPIEPFAFVEENLPLEINPSVEESSSVVVNPSIEESLSEEENSYSIEESLPMEERSSFVEEHPTNETVEFELGQADDTLNIEPFEEVRVPIELEEIKNTIEYNEANVQKAPTQLMLRGLEAHRQGDLLTAIYSYTEAISQGLQMEDYLLMAVDLVQVYRELHQYTKAKQIIELTIDQQDSIPPQIYQELIRIHKELENQEQVSL